ncbi:coat protein [Foveavirus latensarmeniacae]|uniref:Capsid protein n=1 Tax=Foveavirus latensarmeniacae TaxID=75387 RepID=E7DUC3_9VIRU|nr:coat protein [Apricot latent virus]ADT91604.1 coat protein [Apricot latent virus]
MATSGQDTTSANPAVTRNEETPVVTEVQATNAVATTPEVVPVATAPLPASTQPTATTSSFEVSFTPATSISATPMTFPEPVVSQLVPFPPLVATGQSSVQTTAVPDTSRLQQMAAANRGFSEGLRVHPLPITPASSNPFTTGNIFTSSVFSGRGSNAATSSEAIGEPTPQRVFQSSQGSNPPAQGHYSQQHTSGSVGNVITPFTLGNRAPRRAASSIGGTRRRLDSVGLKSIMYEPQAGVVATDAKMRAIGRALIEMGIREDQLTEVGVYLARHCADVGASDKSTLLGTFPGSDITLEEVGTRIKQTEGCTLRQYCAYYAKHVWNLMLQTQKPPANWVGKEFKFETRYAAFDFFFGVESSAALEPADGLIRLPTQSERVANNTSKEIQMYRIRSMEGTQAVNFGEVTGGKIGPKPVLSIKK